MKLPRITIEQAEALDPLGFPFIEAGNADNSLWIEDELYELPYQALVAQWLRDKKNISCEPYRTACGWICMIVDIPSGTDRYHIGGNEEGDDEDSGQFTTYEKALSAGIDKVIEILEKELHLKTL